MSKRQNNGSGLPSPRSPEHLDNRILAHARANAPTRNSHWRPIWGGGLATAAVLVVAVYLTQMAELEQADPVLEAVPVAREASKLPPSPSGMEREITVYAEDLATDAAEEALPMAAMADSAAVTASAKPKKLASGATTDLDLEQALDGLRLLVDQGELEQAQEAYAQLREACSDCDLPETLKEALSP